jgi:hypothetical protein
MTLGLLGTDWKTWAGIFFLFAFSAYIYLGWYIHFSGKTGGILYALIAAQVVYIGQVIGIMLILGWLGILRPIPLIIACGSVSTGVYILGVRPYWKESRDRNREFLLRVRRLRIPLWVILLCLLATVILFRNIFWGWFLPPFMRDDIAYHLTIMGNILQSGAVRYFPSPSEWIRDYPVNSELFQAWNFIFLGLDKLVDLTFLPTVLVGGLAMYGICRRFGFSRQASVVGWAVFAFSPLIFLQEIGSYNDAWKAALFLCGVYLVLSWSPSSGREGDRWTAVLAGTCSGVILGTKFSGVLDCVAIGVLFALCLIRRFPPREAMEKTIPRRELSGILSPLLIFILLTVVFGAYPLIRNAVYEGNPLAPMEVKIGNWILWPGKPASEFASIGSEEVLQISKTWWDRVYLIWFEKYRLLYDSNSSGTGPLWLFLGVPGAVLWVGEAFRKRNGLAIGISLLSLMILLFTPAQWRPRYVLSLLLICGSGSALLFESLQGWLRRIVIALLVLSAAFVTIATLRPAPLEADKVVALVFERDDLQRNAAYVHPTNEFFEWVENRTLRSPAVIVYGRWVDTYPLFGSDLRNTVISLGAYSAQEWDRQLAVSGADMVVVASGSPEEQWTRDSGDFIEVFRYDPWMVWERK